LGGLDARRVHAALDVADRVRRALDAFGKLVLSEPSAFAQCLHPPPESPFELARVHPRNFIPGVARFHLA